MSQNYKDRLKTDKEWYIAHKDKLVKRLGHMKGNIQGFNSILKLISKYNIEIGKINKSLKLDRP